jgi:uncharacterized protein (DUF488 family)
MSNQNQIFTIGHSNHDINYFKSLLNKYYINSVIDVRTSPFSKLYPQFNKEILKASLKDDEIYYIHLPAEFGARRTNQDLLDEDGKVDFKKIWDTEIFKKGLEKISTGIEQGYQIALMCAESDPFECHRFSMVSYPLVKLGYIVTHILKDGTTIDNSELEKRLLEKYKKVLPVNDLFTNTVTDEIRLEYAYRLRNKDIAFENPSN